MTRGLARQVGAGVCSLSVAVLVLGATAPAGYADHRDHPGESAKHADRHHPTAARAFVPKHRHQARPRNPHAAQPAIPTVRPAIPAPKRVHPHIKLTEVLLPDLLDISKLSQSAEVSDARKASLQLGARLTPAVEVPLAATPDVVPPVEVAPPSTVLPSVVVKPTVHRVVTARSLLDVAAVRPISIAPHRVIHSRALVEQAKSPHLTAARAAPVQAVSKELPRIGAWPAGPAAFTTTGRDLPLSVTLGGLLLALAAARGVARMRHQRSDDDAHLTFAAP